MWHRCPCALSHICTTKSEVIGMQASQLQRYIALLPCSHILLHFIQGWPLWRKDTEHVYNQHLVETKWLRKRKSKTITKINGVLDGEWMKFDGGCFLDYVSSMLRRWKRGGGEEGEANSLEDKYILPWMASVVYSWGTIIVQYTSQNVSWAMSMRTSRGRSNKQDL
jgi:hypothetical protein